MEGREPFQGKVWGGSHGVLGWGEQRSFITQPMSGVSREPHKKHIQFNACY